MIPKRYCSYYSSTQYGANVGKIYHYTSAEGIIGILKNKELWFTNIYFLNDCNELFYTYSLIKRIISEDKLELYKPIYDKILSRCNYMLSQNYFNEEKEIFHREEYYISSFSLDKDNIALWNYYTKSNVTGYNICFEDYKFINKSIAQGKVCYSLKDQTEILRKIIVEYNKKYNKAKRNEKHSIIKELWIEFKICSLFFKSPKYEVEQEYRIILAIHNSCKEEKIKCSYRDKNGLIIPYIKLDLKELLQGDERLSDLIKGLMISPINQGETTKYGLARLASGADLYYCPINFSEAKMKF